MKTAITLNKAITDILEHNDINICGNNEHNVEYGD